ncbi:hypothetical protein CIPAW_15G070600 [Carya illinoinensis]|uniref:Uncharacterized protein n=1 Tax=Carya illinoinensis TaxID=32201 RepID=A0A8T1N8T6_CARIL|nr:hypothetical protein CIPAW_15G070600 [Carya illinoinensis]
MNIFKGSCCAMKWAAFVWFEKIIPKGQAMPRNGFELRLCCIWVA